jgi:membrane protease YdiL (CAAX protease family)
LTRKWPDGVLLLAGVVAGATFFLSLGELWPLARTRLVDDDERVVERAREFMAGRGHDLSGWRAAQHLVVDSGALDYCEERFGRDEAQRWIADGYPLVQRWVTFKRRGSEVSYSTMLDPGGRIHGWSKRIDEDHPGQRLDVTSARALARSALTAGLGLDPDAFEESGAATTELPRRTSHAFRYERPLAPDGEFRERIRVVVDGDEVTSVAWRLEVPDAAERERRAAAAPGAAAEMIGFLTLGGFVVLAFWVFLVRLRDGTADLATAAVWPLIVFACLMATWALERADLFAAWEPLWPKWISDLRYLGFRALEQAWIGVVLLAVAAAGDALDREQGGARGSALRELARGRLASEAVALAAWRGFLVGLLGGGAMAAAVHLLGPLADARTAIQPRGFFFYTLNTASPVATSLLLFFGVALAEELGYRFYAGSLLLARTGSRWLAVLAPAVIYGLTHTNMTFLPPAEPWWGRALVLSLVGCVWGWAFLRYGALTVVLSHFTADLFIFNWPQLASGQAAVVAAAVGTMAVPLVPAVAWAGRRLVGWR